MMNFRTLAAACAAALLCLPAAAQNNPGFFIPPAAQPPAANPGPRPTAPRPPARPVSQPPSVQLPQVPPPQQAQQPPGEQEAETPPLQIQLPPVPDLPQLPRANPPPASVIGVISVPDVTRVSTAAQQVDKTIGERREKLNQDAQKEQQVWRELQQQLQSQRASLTPDQIRAKERELQERITNAQKTFRDRNRFIQEALQVSRWQFERELIAVIRQVADSRGMNLVLHRTEIVLNSTEFDISDQVAEQMNKLMPSVDIPADGTSPFAALAAAQARAQQAQAQQASVPVAPAAPAPAVAPAPTPPPAPRR